MIILAPIQEVPTIAARIEELQCPPRVMEKLVRTPETGTVSNGGKVILPGVLDDGLDRD